METMKSMFFACALLLGSAETFSAGMYIVSVSCGDSVSTARVMKR